MEFFRQEYWSGLPIPDPGIKPASLAYPALAGRFFTTFCQKFSLWPIHLELPWTAWLIASLSYMRLWSIWSFWLAFCDCGFHSGDSGIIVLLLLSVPWWIRIRGLCKLPDGRNWLWGKLSLALVGRAMLSKSLMQIHFVLLGKKQWWGRLGNIFLMTPQMFSFIVCFLFCACTLWRWSYALTPLLLHAELK